MPDRIVKSMSKQQQLELDAILRQGGLDLEADVPALRAGFNELMARVPVAGDVNCTDGGALMPGVVKRR